MHVVAFEYGSCYCQMEDVIATSFTLLKDGRCYCQVADGIATVDGRCYCQVVDGMATTGWVIDN